VRATGPGVRKRETFPVPHTGNGSKKSEPFFLKQPRDYGVRKVLSIFH
jgi:hypothetical protein